MYILLHATNWLYMCVCDYCSCYMIHLIHSVTVSVGHDVVCPTTYPTTYLNTPLPHYLTTSLPTSLPTYITTYLPHYLPHYLYTHAFLLYNAYITPSPPLMLKIRRSCPCLTSAWNTSLNLSPPITLSP